MRIVAIEPGEQIAWEQGLLVVHLAAAGEALVPFHGREGIKPDIADFRAAVLLGAAVGECDVPTVGHLSPLSFGVPLIIGTAFALKLTSLGSCVALLL